MKANNFAGVEQAKVGAVLVYNIRVPGSTFSGYQTAVLSISSKNFSTSF